MSWIRAGLAVAIACAAFFLYRKNWKAARFLARVITALLEDHADLRLGRKVQALLAQRKEGEWMDFATSASAGSAG